jgi:hypothetical protein
MKLAHGKLCLWLNFLPALFFIPSSAALEACARGTSGEKKGFKTSRTAAFGCTGLFPVSEGHQLVQNFLQSLKPPFLVGACSCISPVHLRPVRFTNLGYFFPKFLDTL